MAGDWEDHVEGARRMLADGASIEEVLVFLRQHEYSKIASIKAVRQLLGVDLREAKRIVHLSDAWQDRRQQDDEFHEALEEAVRQLARRGVWHYREQEDGSWEIEMPLKELDEVEEQEQDDLEGERGRAV